MILDIGPTSCKKINEIFSISKTLIWNGPMGAFELEPFDNGTINTSLCAGKLTETGELISVAKGGDTVSALKKSKADKKFSYVSLAGGAFLNGWKEKVCLVLNVYYSIFFYLLLFTLLNFI